LLNKNEKDGLVEWQDEPTKCEALSSNLSTTKIKEKEKKKDNIYIQTTKNRISIITNCKL
jgi:hypothetical protein